MPAYSISDPDLFKRPYAARRRRNAAKRRPVSPVSKLLLRVLAVLLMLLVTTLSVVYEDLSPRSVATGTSHSQLLDENQSLPRPQ